MTQGQGSIQSRPDTGCYLCGSQGRFLYGGLKDRIAGVAGEWDFYKCGNSACGLIWIMPLPCEKEIRRAYPENYYSRQEFLNKRYPYIRRFYYLIIDACLAYRYPDFFKAPLWKRLIGFFICFYPGAAEDAAHGAMYLPGRRKGRLLEVGCGTGARLKRVQGFGWKVEGIDISSLAVENAKGRGLEVRAGRLNEQAYPESCFDAIVMNHLIEHVDDPLNLLKECRRSLRADGYLVMVTPNNRSLGHRIFKKGWRSLDPPRHLYIFNEASLEALVRKADFQKITIQTATRLSNWIYTFTANLPFHGHGGPAAIDNYRWYEYILGHLLYLGASLAKIFMPQGGEEIVLTAEKAG